MVEFILDRNFTPPRLRCKIGNDVYDLQVVLASDSQTVSNYPVSQNPAPNAIPVSDSNAKISTGWLDTSVTSSANKVVQGNINGKIDGSWLPSTANQPSSQTPTPNTIPIALSSGKLDTGWLDTSVTGSSNKIVQGNATGKIDHSWLVASTTPSPSTIPIAMTDGKISTDWLDVSVIGSPNKIVRGNSSGKIDSSWLPDGLSAKAFVVFDTVAGSGSVTILRSYNVSYINGSVGWDNYGYMYYSYEINLSSSVSDAVCLVSHSETLHNTEFRISIYALVDQISSNVVRVYNSTFANVYRLGRVSVLVF